MRITGTKCVLRPLTFADAESIARHANDRGVWLNVRDHFPYPYYRAHAESYIENVADQTPRTSFGIAVGDVAIGTVSIMVGVDIERVGAEIGYWIGREYWGRGIASEAVRLTTAYGFATLDLNRLFAVPFAHNAASARVLEKAGYVKEGVMRRSAIKDGVLLDQLLYAAYDDTWKSDGV